MSSITALLNVREPKFGHRYHEALGLRPGFLSSSSLHSRDEAPLDVPSTLAKQANGFCDPEAFPDTHGDFRVFNEQAFHVAFNETLEELFVPTDQALDATSRYARFAQTPVGAMLVCARTVSHDYRTWSEPFLMVVNFPTAMRKGHTSKVMFRREADATSGEDPSPDRPVVLQPGGSPAPDANVHVVLGSILEDARSTEVFPLDERYPQGYYERGRSSILSFSEDGELFASVVASPQTAPGARDAFFRSGPDNRLKASIWANKDEFRSILDDGDTFIADEAEDNAVLLPKFLPLPAPIPFAPGIIGSPKLGVADAEAVLQHYFGSVSGNHIAAWFEHPLVTEWFAAVAADPLPFTTTWHSVDWFRRSLGLDQRAQSLIRSAEIQAWWDTAFRTLAYRMHLDFCLYSAPPRIRTNFERYMSRAYDGLYPANGEDGYIPRELASELWFIRPPTPNRTWNLHFHFDTFTKDAFSVPEPARRCVRVAVPISGNATWTQQPLTLKAPPRTDTAGSDTSGESDTSSDTLFQPEPLRLDQRPRPAPSRRPSQAARPR